MTPAADEARSVALRARLRGPNTLGHAPFTYADCGPDFHPNQDGTACVENTQASRIAATTVFYGIAAGAAYLGYKKSGSLLVGAATGLGVAVVEVLAIVSVGAITPAASNW